MHPKDGEAGVRIDQLPSISTRAALVCECTCVCVHVWGGGVNSPTLLACHVGYKMGSVGMRKPSGKDARADSWSQSEGVGAGWWQTLWSWNELIIVQHLAKSLHKVSTPQRAWLTRKLHCCALGWLIIFGWILFLFFMFSFGILNHD